MDYSPIVAQVWGMLIWFTPEILLIGLLKPPWAKGQQASNLPYTSGYSRQIG
jgi:hypothetical protein